VKFLINVACETAMNEETHEIFVRKPVYKIVEGLPSVPLRGTRVSTNRFPGRSPIALRMCDRSQRLRDVPCAVIFVVAQARLLATVNLRKEWLCKESTARPIRLYTRGLP